MDYSKILLIINSLLLALISLLFFVAGYFLQDLHKDFKNLIERVNNLYTDLHSHITWFDNLSKMFQRQIENVEIKMKALGEKLNGNKK